MSNDPKSIIDHGVMRFWQWAAVIVTVGLNAMDGFDVLSISFAAPGIAKDWGVDKATLGWVLSTELLGMAIGSVLLGGVADKIGRRPTILGCLLAMAVGMYGAAHSHEVMTLLDFRLLTGVGIGGMLASINAACAESSNLRWRSMAMALMVIGYPLGGVVGGTVVQNLLTGGSWRDVFMFGAWATAAFVPLVWFLMPESVAFLDRARPPGAIARINRVLTRFGHAPVPILGARATTAAKQTIADIFKPGLVATTMVVTCAYFAHVVSFYYILKWVPKIVVDMGFSPRAAAGVLTWANVGGVTGGVIFGLIASRAGLKRLTILILIVGSAMVVWFGRGAADLTSLSIRVAVACMFSNAAIVGFYSLFARVFPTHVRATGTGFTVGVGRGGAALAPVCAGYLFQSGLGLQTVSMFMASGSLVAAIVLLGLRDRSAE
jgi:benzoate transport